MKKSSGLNRGFTLVEMILSTAIVAVLALVLLKTFATSAMTQRRTVADYRASIAARNMVEYLKTVDDFPGKVSNGKTLWNGRDFAACWNDLGLAPLQDYERRALKGATVSVVQKGASIPTVSKNTARLLIDVNDMAKTASVMSLAKGEAGNFKPGSFELKQRDIAITLGMKMDSSGNVSSETITEGDGTVRNNQAVITYTFEYYKRIYKDPATGADITGDPVYDTNKDTITKSVTISIPKQLSSSTEGFDATYLVIYPVMLGDAYVAGVTTNITVKAHGAGFASGANSVVNSTAIINTMGVRYVCLQDPKKTNNPPLPNFSSESIEFKLMKNTDLNKEKGDDSLRDVLEKRKQYITKYTLTIKFPNKPNTGTKVADVVVEYTNKQ